MTNALTTQHDRKISMSLHRDLRCGQWFLDQIETRYGPVRNTIRFSQEMQFEHTFTGHFVSQLQGYLPATLNQQVISISGPAITLPDLVMNDLRVLSQAAMDGVQRVILRFNSVVGRVFDFLIPVYRPDMLAGVADALSPQGATSLIE